MFNVSKVLVLGAHPDDGEFGCGGTMSRLAEEGCEIYYAVFSLCEKSIPEGLSPNTLEMELYASAKKLKIPKDHVLVHNYEVRCFPSMRQAILEDLVNIRKRIDPELILLPSTNDLHQDHHTVSEEGIRAFKGRSILGYEQAWNNRIFNTEAFVSLEKRHVNQKVRAVRSYRSQLFRSYFQGDFIQSLAVVRGTQISTKYAEAFEVIYSIYR